MARFNDSQRLALISVVLLAVICLCPWPGWASSARSKYFQAERCYRHLQDNPGQQKYRDKWLRCINGYLSAYKQNPRGEWASVSLYHAGLLYTELYRHSLYQGDKDEALDIFARVIRGYPKSVYREKSIAAKTAMAAGGQGIQDKPSGEAAAQKLFPAPI